jgi:hypothetical protein
VRKMLECRRTKEMYSVLLIIRGNGGQGGARIIEEHGQSESCTLLGHEQNLKP